MKAIRKISWLELIGGGKTYGKCYGCKELILAKEDQVPWFDRGKDTVRHRKCCPGIPPVGERLMQCLSGASETCPGEFKTTPEHRICKACKHTSENLSSGSIQTAPDKISVFK